MKKIFLFIVLSTVLFSQAAQEISSVKDTLEDLFQSPYEVRGTCIPRCMDVKSGYKTKVMNMDVKSGVTRCSVFPESDLDNSIGRDAGTKNQQCVEDTTIVVNYSYLESNRVGDRFKEDTNIVYNETNKLRLSRFLGAMMTLDPDIIDFQMTKDTGIISLKDSTAIFTMSSAVSNLSSNGSITRQTEITATADSFNKANLAYFSNLYSNMSSIYQYLQTLLVVFVGMFFIAQIGFKKGIKWLDKSNTSGDDSKWLMPFVAPILGLGFFFVPIPEDAGMSTSVVQKVTRYFTQQSIQIADRAAAIGINTYLKKLYATVGAQTLRGEKAIMEEARSAQAQTDLYGKFIKDYCNHRYPDVTNFRFLIEADMKKKEAFAPNKFSGTKFDDMSIYACREFETKQLEYQTISKQFRIYEEQIAKSYGNNELQNKLAAISDGIQSRFDEVGWIQAAMIPGISVLIEQLPVIEDNSVVNQQQEENRNKLETRYEDNKEKSFFEKIMDLPKYLGNKFKEVSGSFIGNFAYFILPGAGEVYKKVEGLLDSALLDIAFVSLATFGVPGVGFIGGVVFTFLFKAGTPIAAVMITAKIYSFILSMLPIIICMVSAIIAIVGYLIELAKYFYVTPFVVAFSVTTRRTDKVLDFLVTGIAIFFKPILIVIFIFFALFIYSLVQDVFITMSLEQFTLMRELNSNGATGIMVFIVLSLFSVLLQIIGTIGSCYVMWKIILTAPAWIMKVVGLDKHNSDVFSEGLANKLERYSFQV